MTEKTFFEYLGIADIERIHSQMLLWFFSQDCKAIDKEEKNKIFEEIFRIELNIEELKGHSEYKRIDLIFEFKNSIIVIENKIKSSQHSNQLEDYVKIIEENFPNHNLHFFFLTLIREKANYKGWKEITYSDIFKSLKNLKINSTEGSSSIIKEYIKYLEKLNFATNDFESYTQNYDHVFLNGNKTKFEKQKIKFSEYDQNKFISDNQLETILQKSFLNRLANEFPKQKTKVLETRGDALIDFIIEEGINYRENEYTIFLQLQLKNIKFSFSIYGEKYGDSKKAWIKDVVPIFEKFVENREMDYLKVNEGKQKAYISMSKKIDPYYWHLSSKELHSMIEIEIIRAKELTKLLKNEMNKLY